MINETLEEINEKNLFRDLTMPHIVRRACFYGGGSPYQALNDIQELRMWRRHGISPSKENMFFDSDQPKIKIKETKNLKKKLDYKNWLKDLGNKNYNKGLNYVLSKLEDFKGKIAIVGSSVEKKYPLGRDLDLALIGYGKEDALQFSENLYESLKKEYRENLNFINNGKKINFPAILSQRRVEDPYLVVARKDEIIPGHGGINFELDIFSEKTNSYKNMLEKNSEKLIIDIITDVSYKNRGIKENFDDWKTKMEKAGRKYLVLDK